MAKLNPKDLREKIRQLIEGDCIYPEQRPSPCPEGYDDNVCCEICFLRWAKPFLRDEVVEAMDFL